MIRTRTIAIILLLAGTAVLLPWQRASTQSSKLRRITNTSEEGINLNPSISGDGNVIAFESTEDLANVGGAEHFRAIRASLAIDSSSFYQMAGTRAVTPAISQDGSRIAFASRDNPLGTNADGNSEIFLFDGVKLTQITDTAPNSLGTRVADGNFSPSISDDGRYIAFSSNRQLTGQNADGNSEIYIYDALAQTFTQLTDSADVVGSSDAKISGDGTSVAYIFDNAITPGSTRRLLLQRRSGSSPQVLATDVSKLALTYGRAISDDGTRVVYAAETATNTTQVFLYDGRAGDVIRQITALGARSTEVPLHPTISGDGTRMAFATRRSVSGAGSNPDGSVELYVFDLPSSQMSKITDAPASATAEVLASLNDDGSQVAFNFPRVLSGPVFNSDSANDSEIYVANTPARPAFGGVAILNGASFGNEPSATKAVAPDSIAVARGSNLANATEQSRRLSNGRFPTDVAGTSVTVNGRAAQVFFISPGQVNFLVPPQTEIGFAEVVVTNPENFSARGSAPTLPAAPGLFTKSGDGTGSAVALNSDTLQDGLFDPTSGDLRLTLFATGTRNAAQAFAIIGGRLVSPEAVLASTELPGMDEVHVRVPKDLRGAGTVILSLVADGRGSNPALMGFVGDGSRDIVINEVLADPPGSFSSDLIGDANHDGVRSASDDEFVEIVNASSHDIDIGGYQLLTRASSTTSDALRFAFASNTILPACSAAVVFGGGTFNPNDPVFGGAQVFKSSALSLNNSGGVVTLRDQTGSVIGILEYGGATALSGSANQSLTRSPDVTAGFALHTVASGSNGALFSPGIHTNGAPFSACPAVTRIDAIPGSATIAVGGKQQFTARAFDSANNEVAGVIFSWLSSDTSVATIDQNGLATGQSVGRTQVSATGRGAVSAPATLNVSATPTPMPSPTPTPNIPTISINDAATIEGDSETSLISFTVSLNPVSAQTVSVNYATADGSALAGSDYQSSAGTITFNPGETSKTIAMTVNGDRLVEPDETFFINLLNPTNALIGDNQGVGTIQNDDTPDLVISQTYPGGGLTGASFANDFVELLNRGQTTIDFSVTPYSVQFISTSASAWSKTDLTSGVMIPGHYFLVKETSGGSNGGALPSADATGSINLTSTNAGKVALVAGTTLLTGNCPGDDGIAPFNPLSANVADFVGYGGVPSTANHCYEGSGPAPFTLSSNTIADFRKAGGCTDTNNNVANFFISTPFPRNSTAINICSGGVTPTLSINDITLVEGNSGTAAATFTVNLSAPAQGTDVSFDIGTADGTASVADNDYVAKSLTNQVIPAGETTYTFTVLVNGDTKVEPDQTFLVNLSNVTGASVAKGQGTGTIQNDDFPSLSINDLTMNEGNSGTTTFTFIASLSDLAPAAVTFDIATQDGTATVADNDYVGKSLTGQTIPAGQQTYQFSVLVNGDTRIEPDETFFVNLANVSGATVTKPQAIGTIKNDDSPSLSISDVSTNEGDGGMTPFTFTVTLLPASSDTVVVNYATADGTATAPNDYAAISTTPLTFAPGETIKEVRVQVNGDKLVEPNEIFIVNLSGATNANLAKATGIGTIVNDDISNLVISQIYGGGNNSGATFQNDFVELFNHGTTTVDLAVTPYSVQYASASGSFSSSNMIDLTSGALVPGQYLLVKLACGTSNGVVLPAADASNTSINMSASDGKVALIAGTVVAATTAGGCPTGVTVADLIGYGSANCSETAATGSLSATKSAKRRTDGCTDTDNNAADFGVTSLSAGTPPRNSTSPINDCNAPPALTINDVSLNEGDNGATTFSFTVSLSKPAPAAGVIFDISTQDHTATAGSDYVAKSLTAETIAAGQQTYTFDISVNGDTFVETDEDFYVNITNLSGATVVKSQGVGTIVNDDSPSLSISDIALTEGNSGATNFNFTVTLSQATTQPVTVSYATANGTATAPTDYTAISLTQLTFLPGEIAKQLTVAVNGDNLVEPDEAFSVNLSGATNATISKATGTGTILNDDTPRLIISQIYGGGGNSSATYSNDFIEIFNRGIATIDFSVTPYSVQYASATSNFSTNKTDITSGVLLPGHYFLVQEMSGGAVGSALPMPDATGTINLSATAGKVALVFGTTPLTGSGCPFGSTIVDFLGYGSTANCSETSPVTVSSTNSNAHSVIRTNSCPDTNNNSTDFSNPITAPVARNSATTQTTCP